MSRNGSGVYSKPAGTTAIANTTIESAKYNSTVDDLVADANLARPIVAGERFDKSNLAVKRPANGLSPMRWDEVVGRIASRSFSLDELIEL